MKKMIFDSISNEQKKRFFRQNYGAHLPGYTGHCPTLKFRVGKRFGACTEEIMKELLEKKILKEGPYKPSSGKDRHESSTSVLYETNTNAGWKNDTHLFRPPPYILGYTGYIPGFNSRYGLSFMRAVEEGAREWRENQNKLRARKEAARARIERHDPNTRGMLSRARTDSVAVEIDHGLDKNPTTFHYEISPERPPIVGYTGHIPGVRGEVALSKRYAQAAKNGLELVRKEREQRLGKVKNTSTINEISDAVSIDEIGTMPS